MSETDGWPARVHALETALVEVRGELSAQKDHNLRLTATLREAREQIVTLKAEVDRILVGGQPGPAKPRDLEAEKRDRAFELVDGGVELDVVLQPVEGDFHGSGELLQEAEIILVEIADVIDAVEQHGEALEALAAIDRKLDAMSR
mgnify:CR=1 FL=1